jgi:predicted nucleic-acid-binding Zn-ribbon protein
MTRKGSHCPSCKKSLIEVDVSELSSDRMQDHGANITFDEFFSHFIPYVCTGCGFTMLYAREKLLRTLHDMVLDQGGHG